MKVSYAALTASTGVSLTSVTFDSAYYGTTPIHLDVTSSPGQIFLSYTLSNAGLPIILNSISIDVRVNDLSVKNEVYTTFVLGSIWSRFGSTTGYDYVSGAMNQGETLVDYGSRVGLNVTLNPGDIMQATMTYDVQGQPATTSIGTVTYIPEPSVLGLAVIASSLFLLRREKR